jgi:hypothetical protein
VSDDVIGKEGAYDCGSHTRALNEADSAPLACLLLSSASWHSSPNRRQHTMLLEEAISVLAILTPIAKAVPVLGSPVEGSLEALSKLLELAKARRLAVAWTIWVEP